MQGDKEIEPLCVIWTDMPLGSVTGSWLCIEVDENKLFGLKIIWSVLESKIQELKWVLDKSKSIPTRLAVVEGVLVATGKEVLPLTRVNNF